MKRVLLITEFLNPPFDEGIKKTAYNIYKELDSKFNLLVICKYGFEKDNIIIIKTNALYISSKIRNTIVNFKPNVLIYFPFSSMTFASYLRLYFLKHYGKKIKLIIIALQPKAMSKWQNLIAQQIKPSIALTPSPLLKSFWDKYQYRSKLIPLYTDLNTFKPLVDSQKKDRLRDKYGIPRNKIVVSHMGHLNKGRNLESLIPLQKLGYQIMIVISSSTPKDVIEDADTIEQKLRSTGIIVINKYIEKIEELYQLSDIYIFPVNNEISSIGMPLSILEALACGLPVLTTDFGSVSYLKTYSKDDIYISESDKFVNTIKNIDLMNISCVQKHDIVCKLNQSFIDCISSI